MNTHLTIHIQVCRYATVILYLNTLDPGEGGETVFPGLYMYVNT